jgi:hypothetical protein
MRFDIIFNKKFIKKSTIYVKMSRFKSFYVDKIINKINRFKFFYVDKKTNHNKNLTHK